MAGADISAPAIFSPASSSILLKEYKTYDKIYTYCWFIYGGLLDESKKEIVSGFCLCVVPYDGYNHTLLVVYDAEQQAY
ncbi:hypothetical protein [Schaedlerella sp.]|uniref:hypothetical protein n=1 Tax=Schaedlerella sp. TaxID=2676057 RepID=UPI003746708C|nr:hypothetical protein [Ruminococcus sp.]